jgi:hypothetical protein
MPYGVIINIKKLKGVKLCLGFYFLQLYSCVRVMSYGHLLK